ncbi:WD domain, G-beta repeat containing protein [Metarhizium album ARSEF 1941]|uniref:WD domain, G-beta repeat containing protein n=1 Tax=Metarhizium album (strain ARSEF 1941) TaxID=1081103 RepID=A0A0B2WML4_METAS|nr:WD domain, G-beta repeat containing protein [Metarhizium album ARSEF 1941]KHN94727.1 WD domain, G-beta repeat containing protein [Metarhizium album ARSEF 1941]
MYNRESRIMRKLLGKAAPDSATGDLASITGTTTPIPTSYRPPKAQNAVYVAGAPISCFDVSADRRAVVLGGAHILKTILLDDLTAPSFNFSDGIDVRTAITTRQSTGSRQNVVADQLNIRDVKWHGSSHIYTACASGKVFSYDLTRFGAGDNEPLDYILMQEDSRQMNSLDISPHLKTWLLTGGQDGTARVFDCATTTAARHGPSFRQRFAPLRCIDPIRKVRWSPSNGHEMACCTESGVIMKWDVRQPSRPLLRINAHEKSCSDIAWHPDGTHLISCGMDTKIHTWDLSNTADKRQKPKWTISAPAPVAAVAWRPGLWSASAHARRVAQIAVAYDETSSRRYGTSAVHIWDLARPSMPYKEIDRFETSPSAAAWQDQDMLWTVGQDGTFNQCDVAFAPKVIDRQSTSAMAFSPRGDVLMFLDERSLSHRPRFPAVHHSDAMQHAAYSPSPSNQGLSISRSDSEDDVMGTFLGSRRRIPRKRRPSGRGAGPLSTTPPSAGAPFADDNKENMGLEQSVNVTGVFKPQQAMSFGPIPAVKPVQVYHFLSNAYLETLKRELPYTDGGKPLVERVGIIMEQYAKAAETANLYRLAQTWRILAYAMNLLLKRRAQYHLEVRVGQFQKLQVDDAAKAPDRLKASEMFANGTDTPKRPSGQRSSIDGRFHSVRSLLAEEIESTSNVPTPVARPADSAANTAVPGHGDAVHQHGKRLSPIVEPESLTIGPAAHGSYGESQSPRQRQDSELVSMGSERSDEPAASCTDGYDFYDAEVLARAIDVPVPKKRNDSRGRPYRGTTVRQDSDESFGQMFSISNGTKRSGRTGSRGEALAKSLSREQSELERESGASSTDSPVIADTLTGSNDRPPRSNDSGEEVFMASQTTNTDESYPSQSSFTSQDMDGESSGASPHNSVPEIRTSRSVRPRKKESSLSASPRHDPRSHIVETDYLPWSSDPAHPHPGSSAHSSKTSVAPVSPLDPYSLLLRALDFESKTWALNASAMVLLLGPLVPTSIIDSHRANAILRQHHLRLMRMGLFVEAALLRNLCVQGWPGGLPDWGDNYPSIFGAAQQGVKVGLFCSSCRKPREVDPWAGRDAVWTCERCQSVMAPCPVCGHREAARPSMIPPEISPSASDVESDTWLSEWWYCPGCAHGGHASCLQLWHGASQTGAAAAADPYPSAKYSDGCCPSDGCGHACLPGRYRGETMAARSDELGRAAVESSRAREGPASRGGSRWSSPGAPHDRSVKTDMNDVPQSKAVGMAREALNRGGGGILSSSPGRSSTAGDRERRKSVKFARTDR